MSETTGLHLPVATSEMVHLESSMLYPEDHAALKRAVRALEHTNFATRLATQVGRQIGSLSRFLPAGLSGLVNRAAEKAIERALAIALNSLQKRQPSAFNSRIAHKTMAAASGAAGGLFGLSSLPIELPISTIIMLRAIADIAREEGEDLSQPEVGLACLQVFALGAHEEGDEFTDSGYFAVRGLLANTVTEATRYMVRTGLNDQAAPVMIRLVTQIGARFGIVVSEKLAAQAVPILGAAGGAAVNYAFVDHFQAIASGHFTVRRLERTYGADIVKAEYDKVLAAERHASFA